MLFNIFSTLSAKKSTGGKPSQPTVTVTPQKKPSAIGRVLKAFKSSRSKTQGRQNPYSQAKVNYEIYLEPDVCFDAIRLSLAHLELTRVVLFVYRLFSTIQYFDTYDPYATLASPVAATSTTLPSPASTNADSALLPPPPSAFSTPTTVYSVDLPSTPTLEQSPRLSEDKSRKRTTTRTPIIIISPPERPNAHRRKVVNPSVNDTTGPPVDGLAGKRRDSKPQARQVAINRLVEALDGHQPRPLSLDRLWDAREAEELAKEEEEEKDRLRRAQRSGKRATWFNTKWEPIRAGLGVVPRPTREGDEGNDSRNGRFFLKSPATASPQSLPAGRGVSDAYNEDSDGERDEDDESYEGPFALEESPASRHRDLARSARASRHLVTPK
ncbi:hypothetical protein FRC04_002926 [Tulasnella sp. 424]|nr:hypothetical protein FRC04_002926 [Tulasnella sp. 424]KAG8966961.1 hypothetical protein FRC05_002337 [Tulasnella sp. 425]